MLKKAVAAGLSIFVVFSCGASAAQLATAGCSMAHCTQQLSDQAVGAPPPSVGTYVSRPTRWKILAHGSGDGLGCSSNLTVVACSLGGHRKNGQNRNLRVFDSEGNLLFTDAFDGSKQSLLDYRASYSAPIVFADNSVLAADDHYVALFKQGYPNSVVWKQAKSDSGTPVSPIMVNSRIMIMATKCRRKTTDCPVSTWDVDAGQQLDAQYIVDGSTVYQTLNTVTVDPQHMRAYVLTSAVSDRSLGRLQALDIDPTTGAITVSAWHFDFSGPSGASPLIVKNSSGQNQIFFDGTDDKAAHQKAPTAAFYGVLDTLDGQPPVPMWKQSFPASSFMANAAHDPRGGLWVYPLNVSNSTMPTKGLNCTRLAQVQGSGSLVSPYAGCLIRLSEADGSVLQGPLDPSVLLGTASGGMAYIPSSAVTVSQTAAGHVVLTFGTVSLFHSRAPSIVMAVDVSASPQGALYWNTSITDPIGSGIVNNLPGGQFPIVMSSSGKPRVAFTASRSGPFFIGEP
jgi:hypothetical protein